MIGLYFYIITIIINNDMTMIISRFQQSHVFDIALIARADHIAHKCYICLHNSGDVIASQRATYVINYEQFRHKVQSIVWLLSFICCLSIDDYDYAERLTNTLKVLIASSSHIRRHCNHKRLPQHIVWLAGKCTGDFSLFITVRKIAKGTITTY